MKLPDKAKFTTDSQLQTKLDGSQLTITPVGSSTSECTSVPATAFPWGDGKSVQLPSQRVKQGCSYTITVEFGTLNSAKNSLSVVYYSGSKVLQKDEIGTKPSVAAIVDIFVTQAGKDAGFDKNTVAPDKGDSTLDTDLKSLLALGQEVTKSGILTISPFMSGNGDGAGSLNVTDNGKTTKIEFTITGSSYHKEDGSSCSTDVKLSKYKYLQDLTKSGETAYLVFTKEECSVNGSKSVILRAKLISDSPISNK